MDGGEHFDLTLRLRTFYRGGGATGRQAAFLDDVARSLDDLDIDARSG